jgi:hypothetical protein
MEPGAFKEPYPPALGIAGPSAPSLKQRRTSLALPASARLVPAWSFRDDTDVARHTAAPSPPDDTTAAAPGTGVKKARRKWSVDETNALVEGCQTVRSPP